MGFGDYLVKFRPIEQAHPRHIRTDKQIHFVHSAALTIERLADGRPQQYLR